MSHFCVCHPLDDYDEGWSDIPPEERTAPCPRCVERGCTYFTPTPTNEGSSMADNLKGIPFSSDDEGISYPNKAKACVVKARENELDPIRFEELYVVMFTYTLGNYKALISSSRPDGMYYEVTFDRVKSTTYVDCYLKVDQHEIQTVEGRKNP